MVVTPWLPDVCLTSARATGPVAKVIDLWAKDWFAAMPWQVLGGWDEAVVNAVDPFVLQARAGSMEIRGKVGAKLSLGLAIVGADDHRRMTGNDEALLRDLGARAISDLQGRIAAIAPDPVPISSGPAWPSLPRVFSLLVGTVGEARLAIECTLPELVAMTRSTYPANPLPEPLHAPAAARDLAKVRVAVQLGTAAISLKQLANLEAGDFLLLDSKPGESARLIIEDRPTNLGFLIRSEQDQCLLEFQEEL